VFSNDDDIFHKSCLNDWFFMHLHTMAILHSAFTWLHICAHKLVIHKENFRTSCGKAATEMMLLHMPLGW